MKNASKKAAPKKDVNAPYQATEPTFLVSEPLAVYATSSFDRLGAFRGGIPYAALETVGQMLNSPIKAILELFDIPQTTYNKKKSEKALMGTRDSEVVVLLMELLMYGQEVFNHEALKFQRWLKKPNDALAGHTPESLLDTSTGIGEVRRCLEKIDHGNFA